MADPQHRLSLRDARRIAHPDADPALHVDVRLQIDRNAAKVVDKGNTANQEDVYDYDFMKTQYELLQSRAMAERVASALNLGDDADFFKPRDFSITGAVQGALANIFADAKTAGVQRADQR